MDSTPPSRPGGPGSPSQSASPASLGYMRLLPQETAGTLRRLELQARAKMRGTVTGRHMSPNKGFSVEFAEHRPYTPGDDLRDLDWRVFGKSDRYFIKQYVEETNLRATLMVDCSGSMAYTGEQAWNLAGGRLSKFEYARYLAAALCYFLVRQGDAVGLVAFDDEVRQQVRAASRPSQVRRVLEGLMAAGVGGDTSLGETLHEVAEKVPARGLAVLISDLFGDPDELVQALHHFAYRGHEIVVFHVMAEEELTFPFKRFQEFRDLEAGGSRLKVDPRALRAAYLKQVAGFIRQVESACGQLKADYIPVNTKRPYDQVLSEYLALRKGKR